MSSLTTLSLIIMLVARRSRTTQHRMTTPPLGHSSSCWSLDAVEHVHHHHVGRTLSLSSCSPSLGHSTSCWSHDVVGEQRHNTNHNINKSLDVVEQRIALKYIERYLSVQRRASPHNQHTRQQPRCCLCCLNPSVAALLERVRAPGGWVSSPRPGDS